MLSGLRLRGIPKHTPPFQASLLPDRRHRSRRGVVLAVVDLFVFSRQVNNLGVCACVRACAGVWAYICLFVCMPVCFGCVLVYVFICLYIYIYKYTYVHVKCIYIYTYAHPPPPMTAVGKGKGGVRAQAWFVNGLATITSPKLNSKNSGIFVIFKMVGNFWKSLHAHATLLVLILILVLISVLFLVLLLVPLLLFAESSFVVVLILRWV